MVLTSTWCVQKQICTISTYMSNYVFICKSMWFHRSSMVGNKKLSLQIIQYQVSINVFFLKGSLFNFSTISRRLETTLKRATAQWNHVVSWRNALTTRRWKLCGHNCWIATILINATIPSTSMRSWLSSISILMQLTKMRNHLAEDVLDKKMLYIVKVSNYDNYTYT